MTVAIMYAVALMTLILIVMFAFLYFVREYSDTDPDYDPDPPAKTPPPDEIEKLREEKRRSDIEFDRRFEDNRPAAAYGLNYSKGKVSSSDDMNFMSAIAVGYAMTGGSDGRCDD